MPRNPDKTPCSVQGCRAWAIRGSDPPLCAPHTPGKVGAPAGNQNSLIHGFYSSILHPDDLDALADSAWDTTLNDEILIIRIALRRLQRMISSGLTPGPDPQPLGPDHYARFFGLTFQATNTLSRLLRVRSDLPDGDRWTQIMNTALDALGEQWGLDL